jgi:hypothetical protein
MPAKRDTDPLTELKFKERTRSIFISLLENIFTGH